MAASVADLTGFASGPDAEVRSAVLRASRFREILEPLMMLRALREYFSDVRQFVSCRERS